MNIPYIMARCLILTIIIELLVAITLKINNKKDLINIILVNMITNPLVVTIPLYFNYKFGLTSRWIVLIIMEIMTIIFEGYIYQKYLKYKIINPYIISMILNASSYLIGEIINNFL